MLSISNKNHRVTDQPSPAKRTANKDILCMNWREP